MSCRKSEKTGIPVPKQGMPVFLIEMENHRL